MNRVIVIAALLAAIPLQACSRTGDKEAAPGMPPANAPVVVTQIGEDSAPANTPPPSLVRPTKWVAGTNYRVLVSPLPTDAPAGKVEVIEFFWYGCGHCYALEDTLTGWAKTRPGFIQFRRLHVMWAPVHQQHAKLYFTMLALGREDLHGKIFEEIHKNRNLLAAQDPAASRALQQSFFEKNGVSKKDFDAAFDSMAVATNMQRAADASNRYAVESVPAFAINGKFTTEVSMAGSPAMLVDLVNDLAAAELDSGQKK